MNEGRRAICGLRCAVVGHEQHSATAQQKTAEQRRDIVIHVQDEHREKKERKSVERAQLSVQHAQSSCRHKRASDTRSLYAVNH